MSKANNTKTETQNRGKNEGEEEEEHREKMPWLVRQWLKVVNHLSSTFLGGPRCIKFAHVVNFQKGSTLCVCLALMRWTGNYSATATTYTALHGGYGLCWLLKEMIFPDPKWQTHITIGSALSSFALVLGPYWMIAYNAIAGKSEKSNIALCGAAIVYSLGLCLMMGSDCQKYFVLEQRKGLITNGYFARVRHPNYLGEMMIYGAFAFVSDSVSSWGILAWVWSGLFLPYMLQKEERMSRHAAWPGYKASTGFLLPRLFPRRQEKKQ